MKKAKGFMFMQERPRREAKIEKTIRYELKRHHPYNKQGFNIRLKHATLRPKTLSPLQMLAMR